MWFMDSPSGTGKQCPAQDARVLSRRNVAAAHTAEGSGGGGRLFFHFSASLLSPIPVTDLPPPGNTAKDGCPRYSSLSYSQWARPGHVIQRHQSQERTPELSVMIGAAVVT